MWEKLRVVFTIPELRQKIFLTLVMLAVFRVGAKIPLPMIDQVQLKKQFDASGGLGVLQAISIFSAADLEQITIFGLGIMPYISASIILQLLGSVWPPLEELKKEGESGRKKINEYTRYLTVFLCVIQSAVYLWSRLAPGPDGSSIVSPEFLDGSKHMFWSWHVIAVLTMTCGTIFVMWLGEQIDEFGIGNGISLLIMANILARMPDALLQFFQNMSWELTGPGNKKGIETLVAMVFLFVAVVMGVVFITLGQRRIPTQSAKHVRGRRVYGGTKQYLPLRLNQSGVMPIIFASSLLMLPSFAIGLIASGIENQSVYSFMHELQAIFTNGTSFIHNILYVLLIFFFCYFWTAISFNPKEMAENLRDFGTFIPGYRPGKRTEEYLEKVMVRITYVGAAFLAVVAIVPTFVTSWLGVDPSMASFYGGTGLLIAVSVTFDLIQKIDSHLVMRDYRGLLES